MNAIQDVSVTTRITVANDGKTVAIVHQLRGIVGVGEGWSDASFIRAALESGQTVIREALLNGLRISSEFIPLDPESPEGRAVRGDRVRVESKVVPDGEPQGA
jgi:hypothetical protein